MVVKDKHEYEEKEKEFTLTASFTSEVMDIDLESAKDWLQNHIATEGRHIEFDIEEFEFSVTIEKIKNTAEKIIADNEWVNDSHTKSKHDGIKSGLYELIDHLQDNLHI